MILATVISLALSVVAILISLGSVYYTRRQTQIMEGQEARKEREDQNAVEWSKLFDEAVREVCSIGPKMISTAGSIGLAYPFLFPDPDLKLRIETYLIDLDLGRHRFSPRQASVEQLRMPIVRQTIREVLDPVKKFREDNPDNAKSIGL